jgi:hypothetical protein
MHMMKNRVHVLLSNADKEQFVREAARDGVSLSAWLRDAGRQRLAQRDASPKFTTVEELDAFVETCRQREHGDEPDWEQHRRIIERSIARGTTES